MNLVELDHALRKLRLSGMADVLETRLRHAQSRTARRRSISWPRSSPTNCAGGEDRLLARRHKQARFRDPDRSLDTFDFDFNKKMNRALIYDLATGALHPAARRRALSRPARHRQEPSRPGDRPRRDPAGLSRHLPRGPHRCSKRSPTPTLDGTRKALSGRAGDRPAADHRRPRACGSSRTPPPRICSS